MNDIVENGFFGVLSLHYGNNSMLSEKEKWQKSIQYSETDTKHFRIEAGFLNNSACYYIYPTFLNNIPLKWKNETFNQANEVHFTCPSQRAKNETEFTGRVKTTLHCTIHYDSWSFHWHFDTNGVSLLILAHHNGKHHPLTPDERSILQNTFQPHLQFSRKLFEKKADFLNEIEDKLIENLADLKHPVDSEQESKISRLLAIKHHCADRAPHMKNEETEKFEAFLIDMAKPTQQSASLVTIVDNKNNKKQTSPSKDKTCSSKQSKVKKVSSTLPVEDLSKKLQESFDDPSLEDIKKILKKGWGKVKLSEQYRIMLEKLIRTVENKKIDREEQRKQIEIIEYLYKAHPNLQSVVFSLHNEKTFYHPVWHAKCKLLAWIFLHVEKEVFNCFVNLGIDPALEYVTYIVQYSGNSGVWKKIDKEQYDLINELVDENIQNYELSSFKDKTKKKLKENEIRLKLTDCSAIYYQTRLTDGKDVYLQPYYYLPPEPKEQLTKAINTADFSSLDPELMNIIVTQISNDGFLPNAYRKFHRNFFDYICMHCVLFFIQNKPDAKQSEANPSFFQECNIYLDKQLKSCPHLAISNEKVFVDFFFAFVKRDKKLDLQNMHQALTQVNELIAIPNTVMKSMSSLFTIFYDCVSSEENKWLFIIALFGIMLALHKELPSFSYKEIIVSSTTAFLGGLLFKGLMNSVEQKKSTKIEQNVDATAINVKIKSEN